MCVSVCAEREGVVLGKCVLFCERGDFCFVSDHGDTRVVVLGQSV